VGCIDWLTARLDASFQRSEMLTSGRKRPLGLGLDGSRFHPSCGAASDPLLRLERVLHEVEREE
jgi:hypothetical protein